MRMENVLTGSACKGRSSKILLQGVSVTVEEQQWGAHLSLHLIRNNFWLHHPCYTTHADQRCCKARIHYSDTQTYALIENPHTHTHTSLCWLVRSHLPLICEESVVPTHGPDSKQKNHKMLQCLTTTNRCQIWDAKQTSTDYPRALFFIRSHYQSLLMSLLTRRAWWRGKRLKIIKDWRTCLVFNKFLDWPFSDTLFSTINIDRKNST